VDAPVSGGPIGARNGTLAVMAGGEAGDVELVRPILMSYASRATHMGSLDAGQATKACNQIINFVSVAAVAEALHLAGGFGIDVDKLPEALAGGFADNPILREYARGKREGEITGITMLVIGLLSFYQGNPDPALRGRLRRILLKDLDIVQEASRTSGHATPVLGMIASFFRLMDGPT
jgi:3-hydroxyisobutyrate dehydrogenase-like beta-hydroxyacid dehydrogenase